MNTLKRLNTLKRDANEENVYFSKLSEQCLLDFINKHSVKNRPFIALLDNGNFRATWRKNKNSQVSLQFREDGQVNFVLLSENSGHHLAIRTDFTTAFQKIKEYELQFLLTPDNK